MRNQTHRSDVRGILVRDQTLDLLDGQLHGHELVQKTKGRRWTAAVTRHPWFNVLDLLVNFIDHFVVGFQSNKALEVILQFTAKDAECFESEGGL